MTVIDPDSDVLTLVNVFEVGPDRCDELVELLVEATEQTMAGLDGFVSANIHRSDDGTKVVNYAQWASRGAFEAMLAHPGAQPHMDAAARIADGFTPMLTEAVHTTSRQGSVVGNGSA